MPIDVDITPRDWGGEDDQQPSSWQPADLAPILDGTYTPPVTTLFDRGDGVHLLYPGLTHSFHGEPESGKSLVAQYIAAEILGRGERVLYLDYESDAVSVVHRIAMFGVASAEQIVSGLTYVRPESDPTMLGNISWWVWMLGQPYTLAVIDGVTGAFVASNLESKDNTDVSKWSVAIPEKIAAKTGAAVVMIDHVTKDSQGRGRYAIGGQQKLARITGATFNIETKSPLGRGLCGSVSIRVGKDRGGYLHQFEGARRDGTAEFALVTIDSTGDRPEVTVRPHLRDQGTPLRPTTLMEKVSKELESRDGQPRSMTQIEQNVNGKSASIRAAVELLVAEGFIKREPGPRGAIHHSIAKPYRQADDPQSDRYTGGQDELER